MLKDALRRIKLHLLMLKNGFRLENGHLVKGSERYRIMKSDFLGEYVQVLHLMRLHPFFEKHGSATRCGNVELEGDYGTATVNGVTVRFCVKGDDFQDLSGVFFYSRPEAVSRMGINGSEIYGYLLERDVHEGDIVFDCGSFYGHFALYAAKKAKHVYCFEPDPRNLVILKKNIGLSGLKNITVVPMALSGRTGSVSFNCDGTAEARIAEGGGRGTATVPCTSIEDFCKGNGIERVDFIKMDIEGAEIEVIEGSREFVEKNCGFFAIASYHVVNGEETAKKLEEIFKSIGFNVKTGFPMHKTTHAKKEGPSRC